MYFILTLSPFLNKEGENGPDCINIRARCDLQSDSFFTFRVSIQYFIRDFVGLWSFLKPNLLLRI